MCERTLLSIAQQSSPDYRILLVCNEIPELTRLPRNLDILQVEQTTIPRSVPEAGADKRAKIKRALIELHKHGGGYMMAVDADDLIHRDIASFVERSTGPGWYFPHGYMMEEGSRFLYSTPDFYMFCGTSNIVYLTPDELPATMDDPAEACTHLHSMHTTIVDEMARKGKPLMPLPFHGAIYTTANGENTSGVSLNKWKSKRLYLSRLLRSRPATTRLLGKYGFYPVYQSESKTIFVPSYQAA